MELPQAYDITRRRAFLLRIDAIHHFVMIPYDCFAIDSIPQASCGFHSLLRRDFDNTYGAALPPLHAGYAYRFLINSVGETPIAFLNELEKYSGSEKPDSSATFLTELIPSSKREMAYLNR